MSSALVETAPTVVELRPRFEGSNICTWIGFKHVMYLVEEAVLEHCRSTIGEPRRLFEEYGLCVEVVDSGVRILHALHMDDVASIEVVPKTLPGDRELSFSVQMFVDRQGVKLKCLTGKVTVVLRKTQSATTTPVPHGLWQYIVSEIDRHTERTGIVARHSFSPETQGDDLMRQVVDEDDNVFVWKWRVPYFYCHFSERLQHSGYLRLMEEVVDQFLASRGISIRTMLETRRWIPVVPNARLEILAEALMEETIYTVFTVEHIFKDVTYSARMDCYVLRDGALLHTATGEITHGYAEILNRSDWALVNFDEQTLASLNGTAIRQSTLPQRFAQ